MNGLKIFFIALFVFFFQKNYCQIESDSISIDTVQLYGESFIQRTFFANAEIRRKELHEKNDSILRFISFYKKGELDGYKREWWEGGELKISVKYKDGLPVSEWKEFYKDGKLSYEVIFDSTINIGISYYESGVIKSKEIMDKSFTLAGRCVYWCENSQKTKDVDFSENYWRDVATYYCNGQIASKGTIVDTYIRTGEWTEWYDNGNIKTKGSYLERLPGEYLPEKKIGEWKCYFQDGNIEHMEYYSDEGKEIGIWKYFNEDSTLQKEIDHRNRSVRKPSNFIISD